MSRVDETPKILRNRARCKLCDEIIESNYRHDFKSCKCGEISVDGGTSYLRRLATSFENLEELSEFELEVKE